MALRGRPVKSEIRKNIVEILFVIGEGCGYEIHKIYNKVFPQCTQEVIYYHLKKGLQTEEFKVKQVKLESGNYSWGPQTRKILYELGERARPLGNEDIKKVLDERK